MTPLAYLAGIFVIVAVLVDWNWFFEHPGQILRRCVRARRRSLVLRNTRKRTSVPGFLSAAGPTRLSCPERPASRLAGSAVSCRDIPLLAILHVAPHQRRDGNSVQKHRRCDHA